MGASRMRARLQLVGVFLLFFAPIVVAWILNLDKMPWRPRNTVNHGTLITPPRLLAVDRLHVWDGAGRELSVWGDKWTLLWVGDGPCQDACRAALYAMQQARLALGKDMGRVQRVYVARSGVSDDELGRLEQVSPGLLVVRAERGWRVSFADAVREGQLTSVYLMDPKGYLILRYDLGSRVAAVVAPAKGMLEDLKRLLKISTIG